MKKFLLLLLLLIPTLCFGDSESTISGKTAQAHIIQAKGVSLRPRPYLNITGDSVVGTDSGGKTVITISASGTVGVGTTGKLAVYTGTTTTGPLGAPTLCTAGQYATGIDASGNATGCTAVSSGQWLTNGTVGIGTTSNVGIGTIAPTSAKLFVLGNVGIGTTINDAYQSTAPPTGGIIVYGNVGIGTWTPNAALTLNGMVSDFGQNFNGNAVTNGIDSATKVMLHNDDAGLIDSSITPHAMTKNGSAARSATQSVFGGFSMSGTGAGDYNSTPDATDLNLGSGDFALGQRAYFNNHAAAGQAFGGQYGASGNFGWIFYYDTSNKLYFQYSTDGTNPITTKNVSWTPSDNTWYEVEVDRSGNNLYFFVDGTQVGATQDVTGVTIFNSTANMNFGAFNNGSFGFNGYLDEQRYTVGSSRHTANYTIPTSAYSGSSNQPRQNWYDAGSLKWSVGMNGANTDAYYFSNGVYGSNDRMVITTGGNVGINTITPGVVLDVVGTMRMNGTGAGSFRVQAGANTACTTTCTTGKALFGFDDGTLGVTLPHLVGPADATAEECLCGS